MKNNEPVSQSLICVVPIKNKILRMGKKKLLEIEFSFQFHLFGIISSSKPHKLAWEINRSLGKKLAKMADYSIEDKLNVKAEYVHFAACNEINDLHLFKNKPSEGSESRELLVPEYSHFDYILLIRGDELIDNKRLLELLRNNASIELIAFIPLAALKSKENFIF